MQVKSFGLKPVIGRKLITDLPGYAPKDIVYELEPEKIGIWLRRVDKT